jgi:stage II sporulation protein D
MKKSLSLLIFLFIVTLGILFFPKMSSQCILIENNSSYITFYTNGSIKTIKANVNYTPCTVFNYKYNYIYSYNFQIVSPIKDRVMLKQKTNYELERLGNLPLKEKCYYYKVDNENKLTVSDSKSLIIGKNNLQCYKDSTGKLSTFLIFPMDYSTIRTGISSSGFNSLIHDNAEIKCLDNIKLYSIREPFSMTIPKDSIVTIEPSGTEIKVVTKNSSKVFKERIYLQGNSMNIKTITRGNPLFNPSYTGVLELIASGTGLSIINETTLEDYLCKVVPSEMPVSGGLEPLKCQAIAARTYAISDMLDNRFASSGFHVDDSTQSQVYNNSPEQPLSNKAVSETSGLILTYNNAPIDAKYYSTSCGTGVGYSDIWFKSDGSSEDKPYLKTNSYLNSKVTLPKTEAEWLSFYKNLKLTAIDSSSPYFRWHVEMTTSAITRSLNKSLKLIYENHKDFMTIIKQDTIIKVLPELQNLKNINIIKRSEGGNIIEIAFIFENATVNLKGDYNIRSAIRCSSEYTNEAIAVVRYKDKPINNSNFLPSSFFSVEKVAEKFVFYGGGYGHGVGMSQSGAMELGKKGLKYSDILKVYYKDVITHKIY